MPETMTPSPTILPAQGEAPSTPHVSENQRKIIEDRYLRGEDTIESWLKKVAKNIAFAELLHHPDLHLWSLFDGVRVYKKETITSEKLPSSRSWLFHHGLSLANDRDMNIRRFLQNCESLIRINEAAAKVVQTWTDTFYDLLSSWRFLPNSPTLMNAGRELQQLSACYVIPVEDSMEGITRALQAQALIHKSGGGTGFSFEKIRPAGDPVQTTKGVASGVINFMQVFDRMTEAVKQGGSRRGANMGILPYWHPEIREFIRLKSRPGMMENFNISVAVDDVFMEAIRDDQEIDLLNPRTKEPKCKVRAKDIFNLIVENAWDSGDPGLVFINTINNSFSNPTPSFGPISATNPCGEQPLYSNESCNLGSINLAEFVRGKAFKGDIDWDNLKETVHAAVRFLDNVIDINNYPLPEIEQIAKNNRRIGLGVMGWAEMLVKLGIPYDSRKAANLGEDLMQFINDQALAASEDLAAERGPFPNWKNSIYDPHGPCFKGKERTPRHSARTTIAPTGTISLAAGLQGGGIEPFFAIAYTRYTAKALEKIKKGLAPDPADIYYEVNPLFREIAERHNFFGMKEAELWEKIENNGKSVRGLSDIPDWIQTLFATAQDISTASHIEVQSAFQRNTDNAVSKTINMPQEASFEDISRSFMQAWKSGCKGITVYRDRSREQQVLNLDSREHEPKTTRAVTGKGSKREASSEYFEIKTGYGALHVHIEFDHDGPFRVFASITPMGTEVAGHASITGILISKYLEEGGDPNQILTHLLSTGGDRPVGTGENRIKSIPHGIGVALRTHLKKHGWLDTTIAGIEDDFQRKPGKTKAKLDQPMNLELWNLAHSSHQCPTCFSTNIKFNAGCSGVNCLDCGHSECQQ